MLSEKVGKPTCLSFKFDLHKNSPENLVGQSVLMILKINIEALRKKIVSMLSLPIHFKS